MLFEAPDDPAASAGDERPRWEVGVRLERRGQHAAQPHTAAKPKPLSGSVA